MSTDHKMKYEDIITLIDSFPGGMGLVNLEGKVFAINKHLSQVLNIKRDEYIGKKGWHLIELFASELRKNEFQKAIETGKLAEFVDYERGKWWKTTAVPLIKKNKSATQLAVYVEDITNEMKEEEKKLLNQEHYFLSLIENTSDIITVINDKGIILYQSPSLTKNLGYELKERIGKHILSLIHKDDVQKLETYFKKILKKPGYTKKLSYRIKHKNGSYRYFESIGDNQLYNPQVKGIIISSRDITDRKVAEQQSIKSQKDYQDIFTKSADGILIADPNGNILDINPAGINIFGYKNKKELVGKPTSMLYAKKNDRDFVIKNLLKKGSISELPLTFKKKDGSEIFTIGSANIIKNKQGDIDKIFGIFRDETQTIKNRNQIKRTKEYLQKIIDNASELIFTVGSDYKIKTWNDSAVQITGIKDKQVINKDIRTFNEIENKEELSKYIKNVFRDRPAMIKYINFNTRFNTKRLFRVSPSIIRNDRKDITDIIFLCQDVTFMEIAQAQLISGLGYLIINESSDYVNNVISGLIQDGREGIFFTRNMIKEGLENIQHKKLQFSFFSKYQDSGIKGINDLDEIYKKASDFIEQHKHAFIFINRIDYLVIRFDFTSVMNLLYKIHDLINQQDILFLICINDEMFTDKERSLFLQEFNQLPSQKITDIYLDANLFEMLEFIYMENNINRIVTQMKICKYLSISKVTSQKRIKELLSKKLIISKNVGRANHLFITEKGKELLKHWKKP